MGRDIQHQGDPKIAMLEVSWSNAVFWVYTLYLFTIPFKVPNTLSSLMLLILVIPAMKGLAGIKRRGRDPLEAGVLLFSGIVLLSTITSVDPTLTLKYFKKDILIGLILFFSTLYLTKPENTIHIYRTLLLSFLLAMIWGINIYDSPGGRLAGVIGHSTRYGKFLDLVLPIAISGFFVEKIPWLLLPLATFFLGTYSLVRTMTRGAWVGVSFATLTLFISAKRWYMFLTFGIAIVLILPFVPSKGQLLHRVASVVEVNKTLKTDPSLLKRLQFYKTGIDLIKERPVLGWGYGRKIPRKIKKKLGHGWFLKRKLKPFTHHCHDSYMELALETGIMGLMAFLFFLGAFFYDGIRVYRKASPSELQLIALGIMAGILALMIHGFVTDVFQKPFISYMFILSAILYSMERSLGDQGS